jgi:hypothetical protein
VKPQLEVLEDRLVLDAYTFVGAAGGGDGTSWNQALNWANLTNPDIIAVPSGGDDVTIGPGFAVVIAGTEANVNSLNTAAGSALTIVAGDQLTINSNAPGTTSNILAGTVVDPGRIIANTTSAFDGTGVVFAGGALIGPGDLNGNLTAGPGSSFVFPGGPIVSEFLPGATFGLGSGNIVIAGNVQVDGTLEDNNETIVLTGAGDVFSPTLTSGAINVNSNFNWLGGTIVLGLGVTVNSSGTFTTSGPAPKTLYSPLINESAFTSLGGAGPLGLFGPFASIENRFGLMKVSLPAITATSTSTAGVITNDAGADFEATPPDAAPTVISAPFTNNGNLDVDGGVNLTLVGGTTPSGASTVALDGVLKLIGDLTLQGPIDSPTGFAENATPGFLFVGDPISGTTSMLTVYAGAIAAVSGNLEVLSGSLLTGGGQVLNAGRLQLDFGSSTFGLGSYVQKSDGTLALDVDPMTGGNSMLAVTGTAQLSGTLILRDYTPVVGATFIVVTAAAVEDHFDTIPDGMEETDGPAAVTVTQVDPPAGE